MGTLKGVKEGGGGEKKKESDAEMEIFPFLVLVIFCSSVYTTHKISHGGVAKGSSGARATQNDLGKIKDNNKHVRGIWTSAVTQALTTRPRQFHESKSCCLGLPYIKQNQHLS